MLLLIGGQGYFGSEAMHVLSVMTSGLGLLNRLVAWTFRSPGTTRLLYPILKAGRSATPFLLRRPRTSVGDNDSGIGMSESNR